MKLPAFHGKPDIKEKYLNRVKMHQKADNLIQGTGWSESENKGCAVGCTLEKYSHAAYEDELGIPMEIAALEDSIFEALDKKNAMAWPEQFLSAIKPGADLSQVFDQFVLCLLVDPEHGVVELCDYASDAKNMVKWVGELFDRSLSGYDTPKGEWGRVATAAEVIWRAWVGRKTRIGWVVEVAWAAAMFMVERVTWIHGDRGGRAEEIARAAWAAWAHGVEEMENLNPYAIWQRDILISFLKDAPNSIPSVGRR
jgi:hypothetical protein